MKIEFDKLKEVLSCIAEYAEKEQTVTLLELYSKHSILAPEFNSYATALQRDGYIIADGILPSSAATIKDLTIQGWLLLEQLNKQSQ